MTSAPSGLKDLFSSWFQTFAQWSEGQGIVPETSLICILLLLSLTILSLCCVVRMFCCHHHNESKSPGSPYTRRDVICKKGMYAMMLARMDEFDTLTPLILTPAASSSATPSASMSDGNGNTQTTQFRTRSSPVAIESDSPPPPRRQHHGKTLIVPLNAGRYRVPAVPLLGTPDSRVTSLEGGTTKSCATIPEDDEDVSPSCERIDDLVSIDRTSVSMSEQKGGANRYYFSNSNYNLFMPQVPPEFQSSSSGFYGRIPVPMYSAPDIPRPTTLIPERKPSDESSIGSANSSLGTSPVDTTGSASDSFYINSDVISSTNASQVVEANGCNDSDVQSKYLLHRIEEESEVYEDSIGRRSFSQNIPADLEMPRSISQQFEMMRRA